MSHIFPKYLAKVNPSLSRMNYRIFSRDFRNDIVYRTAMFGFMYFFYKKKESSSCYMQSDFSTEHSWSKSRFELFYGVFSIPHASKKSKGGEDCYFVNNRLLAVADGVGGWNDYGIDPAKYSRELCNNVKDEEANIQGIDEFTAKDLLVKAANKTHSTGSSTLCVVLLDSINKRINTAYIGDSVYMIARFKDDKFINIYKAPEQQHRFNTPFQIGSGGDDPSNAVSNSHDILNNDVLIIATDGLWDNIDEDYILNQLNKHNQNGEISDINQFAKLIAIQAEIASNNKSYNSPFAKKAKKENLYYIGGKPDDISVIVAQVVVIEDKAHLSESLVVKKKGNFIGDKSVESKTEV